MVSDAYGGSMHADLKHGIAPKHDPAPLATLMAYCTERLGIVPTLSSSFYPPFLLAAHGRDDRPPRARVAWAGTSSRRPRTAPRRTSGSTSSTSTTCATRWPTSTWTWSPSCGSRGTQDAVVRDRERGVYADADKVHRVDFEGRFYKSRGPLNTVRPPQGRPVLCQAGASPPGRDFAAKYADTIVAPGTSVEQMKAYRDDIRARIEGHGRKPDDCKVLFLIAPVVGETVSEAQERSAALGGRSRAHRVRPGRDLVDHRDRLLAVRPRSAAARGHDQRRARLARALRQEGSGQDAAGARGHRSVGLRRAHRHARDGRRQDGVRSWTRSAATAS